MTATRVLRNAALTAVLAVASIAAAETTIGRFGVITDLHHTTKTDTSSRTYSAALAKCQQFVNVMNADGNVDFVVELGDFVDTLNPAAGVSALDNLASIENAYTAFNGPNYHVIGNHEFDDATRAEILPNLNNDDPNNPTLADGTYYSYDAGGLHCVVLDADYTNDPPHTPFEKDGGWNWKDAWIPQAEMDWLAADLAASDLPTVVFTHQVVHRDNTEAHTIKNADALQQLLVADGDVLAVFSGHDHSGEFVIEDDIAYIVMNGNVGISKNWQADLGVDGLDPVRDNQFALVEVTDLGDGSYRIDVDGYGFQTTYQNVVVPEPATMSLLALGGLAALRRRRNR